MLYCDTSALLKMVIRESESDALSAQIAPATVLASSDLTRTELLRAARRGPSASVPRARDLLTRLFLLTATPAIFDAAGVLEPLTLRSLDAVHLASALTLGDELEAILTYDRRMAEAAETLGLRVLAPTG